MTKLRSAVLASFVLFSLIVYSINFQFDLYEVFIAVTKFVDKSSPIEFYSWAVLIRATFDTVLMALAGTTLGFVVALAAAAATKYAKGQTKKVLAPLAHLARSAPDFVFALILAQVLGAGPVAGTIAITLGTFGVSFKTLLQMFLGSQSTSSNQLRLIGATSPQRFFGADLPVHANEILAQFSYRFEINLRIATIIGITGAGGLGLLLRNSIGMLDYPKAAGIVFLILLTVFAFEAVTRFVRNQIRQGYTTAIGNPSAALVSTALFLFSFSIILFWSFENGSWLRWLELAKIVGGSLNFSGYELPSTFVSSIGQSILLTVGTAGMSFLLALLIGISSSKYRSLIPSLAPVFRLLSGVLRAVPTIIWALILIPHFGLGLAVASTAIMIGASLLIARNISDLLDSYDFPALGMLAISGVSRLHITALAVRKTSNQRIIRAFFFLVDFVMRYSVILGILGVGGLGSELNNALRLQDYNSVLLVVLVLAAWLLLVEKLEKLYFSPARYESRKPLQETRQ